MPRTVITPVKLENYNEFSQAVSKASLTQAVDASEGAEFVMRERDDKYLILIENSNEAAKTVTIKAGNGLQGVADLTHSVEASSCALVALESGRFKNVSGADKGKVVITGETADIKVAVFVMP